MANIVSEAGNGLLETSKKRRPCKKQKLTVHCNNHCFSVVSISTFMYNIQPIKDSHKRLWLQRKINEVLCFNLRGPNVTEKKKKGCDERKWKWGWKEWYTRAAYGARKVGPIALLWAEVCTLTTPQAKTHRLHRGSQAQTNAEKSHQSCPPVLWSKAWCHLCEIWNKILTVLGRKDGPAARFRSPATSGTWHIQGVREIMVVSKFAQKSTAVWIQG